jgi:hypothetical protein
MSAGEGERYKYEDKTLAAGPQTADDVHGEGCAGRGLPPVTPG